MTKKANPLSPSDDPLLDRHDLKDLGIRYHPSHLRRMWTDGRFPKPKHLTPRKLVWRESVILAWVAKRLKDGEG